MTESLSLLDSFTLIWPKIFISDFLRYTIPASGAFLWIVMRGRKTWAHRRIRNKTPTTTQMKREIRVSVVTVLIFSLNGFGVFLGAQIGIYQIYDNFALYGLGYFAFSLILVTLAHDTYFYWAHRLMHVPRLFPWFHRTHHKSHNPTPWTAYAFDPLEAMVQAAFLPLFLLFAPLHGLAIFIFLVHMILRNVLGHLGYEIMPRGMAHHPILSALTTATHHDQHHANGQYNFGLYFTWWDRLMGTENPKYRTRFAQITSAAPHANQQLIPSAKGGCN